MYVHRKKAAAGRHNAGANCAVSLGNPHRHTHPRTHAHTCTHRKKAGARHRTAGVTVAVP